MSSVIGASPPLPPPVVEVAWRPSWVSEFRMKVASSGSSITAEVEKFGLS